MGAGMLADAFGCLQSLGIVISRRHPTSTCVSRGDGLMPTSLVVPCTVFGPVFLINGSISSGYQSGFTYKLEQYSDILNNLINILI